VDENAAAAGWIDAAALPASRFCRQGFSSANLRRVPLVPAGVEQIDIRLIDKIGPDANPNLDFVLTDTVRLIEQLRNEGRTVLLHCVACQSRTPTVAALYGAHKQDISGQAALQEVTSVLPDAYPNSDFRSALNRLAP
jgi:ADP-ribosyl-[dinitrogen reductase] hydrolase